MTDYIIRSKCVRFHIRAPTPFCTKSIDKATLGQFPSINGKSLILFD